MHPTDPSIDQVLLAIDDARDELFLAILIDQVLLVLDIAGDELFRHPDCLATRHETKFGVNIDVRYQTECAARVAALQPSSGVSAARPRPSRTCTGERVVARKRLVET